MSVNTAKTEYFNLTLKGLGYLSNVRQVNHQNGSFLSCVVNALSGPTDSPPTSVLMSRLPVKRRPP